MNPYSVILKPIISEKSTSLREIEGKYVFEVNKSASKADITKAVSLIWNVTVSEVNTLIKRGKIKRRGNYLSKPRLSKRAVVKLADGSKLPLFEEQ